MHKVVAQPTVQSPLTLSKAAVRFALRGGFQYTMMTHLHCWTLTLPVFSTQLFQIFPHSQALRSALSEI